MKPLIPRNYELTKAIVKAKEGQQRNFRYPKPGRSFENRSYAKIRAKVTLPKLGGRP